MISNVVALKSDVAEEKMNFREIFRVVRFSTFRRYRGTRKVTQSPSDRRD